MNPKIEASTLNKPPLINIGKRVSINTLWLLMARLGPQGLMALFTILLARRLSEVGLGQYTFIVSIIYLANVVTTFGTDMHLIREIAARRNLSLIPASLLVQLGLSIPIILLIYFITPALPNQTSNASIGLRLYSLSLIPLAFYNIFSATLRGFERMDSFFLVNLTIASAQVGAAWFIIQPGTDMVSVALFLLGVQTFSAVLSGVFCLTLIPGSLQFLEVTKPTILKLIKTTAPIAMLGIFGTLYQRLNLYMLAILSGPAVTGWFAAAQKIVDAPKIGHIALMGALFPVMARAYTPDFEIRTFDNIFAGSLKLLLIFAGIIAILVYTFADSIIIFLYGSDFDPAIKTLKILVWTLIPFTITNYFSLVFLAAGKENKLLILLLISLGLLLTINLFGIPRMGMDAASLGILITESFFAGVLLIGWRKLRIDVL